MEAVGHGQVDTDEGKGKARARDSASSPIAVDVEEKIVRWRQGGKYREKWESRSISGKERMELFLKKQDVWEPSNLIDFYRDLVDVQEDLIVFTPEA
ncbi:hypothetical protein BC629DRAFT_1591527 [Irpex lacteus]|nr:hypothetical protein BC629DRAFT_1591527 [Irpex lacteus]